MTTQPTPAPAAKTGIPLILVIAGVTLVIAGIYTWGTFAIRVPRLADPVGPRAFPIIISAGLVAAALLMLVEWLQSRKEPAEAAEEPTGIPGISWVVAGIFVWTMGYIAVFEQLGYVLATLIYITPMMFYFNRGKTLVNLLSSVGFTAISYYVLAILLGAQLPFGELLRPIFQ